MRHNFTLFAALKKMYIKEKIKKKTISQNKQKKCLKRKNI